MKRFVYIIGIVVVLVSQAVFADVQEPLFSSPVLTAVGFTVEKDFFHNRPLLLASNNGGETWTKPLSGLSNLPASGVFEKTSCSDGGTNALCVAVGSQDEYKEIPLLAVKPINSTSWGVKYLKFHGAVFGASCTSARASAMCAIGFQDFVSPAFVLTTRDGGAHWYKKSVEGLPTGAHVELTSISCMEHESDALCVAIGAETLFDNHEFIGFKPIVATGRNNYWTTKDVSSLTDNLLLSDVSCTGNGSTAMCAAIGAADHDTPGVIVSKDGGETWVKKIMQDLPQGSDLKHVSCTGVGDSAVCTAIGGTLIDPSGQYLPLIVVSQDGGDTWSVKSVNSNLDDSDYSKELRSIHCSGEGSQSVCIAAGFKELPDANSDSESTGILVVSSDGGNHWNTKSVDGLPLENNFFSRATCMHTDINIICSAVGSADGKPMIAMSNDGGEHWGVSRSVFDLQLRNGVLLEASATN